MATFKVGQRVRITGALRFHADIGKEGTIVLDVGAHPSLQFRCYGVEIDGTPCPFPPGGWWSCLPEHLAPLTDPKADAFIESIKRLKPYEEPTVNPDRVTKHNVPMATFRGSTIYLTERGAFVLRDGEWIDLGNTRNN